MCVCQCHTKRGAEQTGVVSNRSNKIILATVTAECVWPPKVTSLVQSKSGDLYLALQMVCHGLCLGALQFRLQCVLLPEEWGLWIMKRLLFR